MVLSNRQILFSIIINKFYKDQRQYLQIAFHHEANEEFGDGSSDRMAKYNEFFFKRKKMQF